MLRPLCGLRAPSKKSDYEGNNREYQKDVDEGTEDVYGEANNPQDNQDDRNDPEN
jgi:hypothetical protein